MVRNCVGPPVTGDDFFERREEQRRCWEHLETDHLLLLAPRRVGKTSLMRKLEQCAPEHGFEACYMSAADAADEAGFVQKLSATVGKLPNVRNVWRRIAEGPLGRTLERVTKVGAAGFTLGLDAAKGGDCPLQGERLARSLEAHETKCLLLVDEVPVFVLSLLRQDPTGERARRFLTWFRALRQRPVGSRSLRWLLAGSIGLDTVAARLNLGDTINDLHIFHLGPFSDRAANDLLDELAWRYGLPLSPEVKSHLLRRIGWAIPFYIQLIFSELCANSRGGAAVGIHEVDRAFDDLLKPGRRAYFDYWRQRLDAELGNLDAGYALMLLNAIAASKAGASRTVLAQRLADQVRPPESCRVKLQFLLDVLESDGYIAQDYRDGSFRFRSPLLREFWIRRVP
jgi:hypothetical protein